MNADAESGNKLLYEKNFRNETPLMLDDKGRFEELTHHIWEAASSSSTESLQRLDIMIKSGNYDIN